MALSGMDIAWVTEKGRLLQKYAEEVGGIMQGVETVYKESLDPNHWNGEHQKKFAGWYNNSGRTQFKAAAAELQGLSATYARNAAEQAAIQHH